MTTVPASSLDRQQLRFGEHRVGAHAGFGETLDPRLHRLARDDGDGHAFGRQPFRKREMQILDRRHELIFDRERHGLANCARCADTRGASSSSTSSAGTTTTTRCARDDRLRRRRAGVGRRRAGRPRSATATTGRRRDEVGPADVRACNESGRGDSAFAAF